MTKWQDAVHLAVYAPLGIGRVGPRRQRLSHSERKAREQADAGLAKTLAAEHALKAKWREEVGAEIRKELSQELMRWKEYGRVPNHKIGRRKRGNH